MKPQVGLQAFWKSYDRATYIKAAVLADRLGYNSFWVPETWGYDAFSLLTEIAVKTKRIKLGTGIINVFSRSPALIAMQAATLDEISGGRFILGIGTSAPRVIEGLHGRSFTKPLTQTRDVIRVVRTLLEGGSLHEAGAELHEYRPFALEMPKRKRNVPIYVAALKQKSITNIGEMADGWMPVFWPYTKLDLGREWIREGAERANRDPNEIVTAPATIVIPLPGDSASKRAREIIALYVGGMGEFYRTMLSDFGWKNECDQIAAVYENKATRKEAAKYVTDEMMDVLTVSGNPIHCIRELKRRRELGVQAPVVALPPGLSWPALQAFMIALAPVNWR